MTGPLAGYRVLDATHVLAGPYAGYQLALLGADVIRVENPHTKDIARHGDADPTRSELGLGSSYLAQGANKRSITLDLKQPAGRDAFLRIADGCDVVVENFRPGKMISLGLGAEVLQARKPALVYCSITGFGQTGPLAQRPAYDYIVQGVSGVMAVSGEPGGPPTRVGFPMIDYVAGLMAAFAITSALLERQRTGVGGRLDVSMLDAALAIMGPLVGRSLLTGEEPQRIGNRPNSGSPLSGMYDTRDGRIVVTANTAAQGRALLGALGWTEVLADPRLVRWQSHPEFAAELAPGLARRFATRTALEWEAALEAASVPCGRVRDLTDVLADPHLATRDFLHTIEVPALGRAITVPGVGFKLDGSGGRVTAPPPRPGVHTVAVLGEAGFGNEEIERLLGSGAAVGPAPAT